MFDADLIIIIMDYFQFFHTIKSMLRSRSMPSVEDMSVDNDDDDVVNHDSNATTHDRFTVKTFGNSSHVNLGAELVIGDEVDEDKLQAESHQPEPRSSGFRRNMANHLKAPDCSKM